MQISNSTYSSTGFHYFNEKNLVPKVLLLISISVLLLNYLQAGILAIVITTLVFLYGERFLIGLMIVSLLTIVSGFGSSVRLAVHLINFFLLAYLFISKYGFEFSKYPKIPKQVTYFLLLYYFAMIISTVLSGYFYAGMAKIARQSVFFVMAYIFFSFLKDYKDVKTFVYALLTVSVVIALSSVYEFSQSGNQLADLVLGARYRAASIFGGQDAATAFFILILPVLFAFTFSKKYKEKRFLLATITTILILGLVLMISRSAVLAIFLSTLFIFLQLNKKLFIRIAIVSIIGILLFIFIQPLNDLVSMFFRIRSGLSQRDYFWQLAYNIIRDNPVFGIGPGSYKYLEFNYSPVLLNSWAGHVIIDLHIAKDGSNGSHNIFLTFASDMGIPGIISLFYFIWLVVKMSVDTVKKARKNYEIYLLTLSVSAALVSMFIRCIFDSIGILTYGVITADLGFWLLFGVLIYFYQKPEEYFINEKEILFRKENTKH